MEFSRRSFLQAGAVLAAAPQAKPAANDRVQVGFIGTGARAHQIIPEVMRYPGAEIIGVTDAYKGRVERAIERTKGQAKEYANYREMLANKEIDAVFVITPDHLHFRQVMDALNAGKDVYCDKPLTFRSSEGVEIMEAAKRLGRIVQVGSQPMSGPLAQKAREMVQSGRVGKVTAIRAAFNRNTASGAWIYPIPPDASEKTVNWAAFLGDAPKQPFSLERFFRWRCYWDYSGGIATDLFVHLCTTIHFVMGSKAPAKVMAMGQIYRWKETRDVPDTLNAVLEYPDGFAVNLSATFNNQTGAESTFDFLGTEGTISLASGLSVYPQTGNEDNGWIIDSWPRALAEAYYRDPKNRKSEMPSTWEPKSQLTEESYRSEGWDSTYTHCAHFFESMRTRKPYWEDAENGHYAAACAHMVNRSAREGRMVEWDFRKNDMKA